MDGIHTLLDDERGTLKVEFFAEKAFLHATFRKPVAAMRHAHRVLPEIRAELRRMGFPKTHIIVRDTNEGLYRFGRHMGFRDSVLPDGRPVHGGGYILMEQSNG